MSDVSGVDNLNSSSNGSTSLAGIQSAIDNLNAGKAESSTVTAHTGASSGVHGVAGSVVGTTDTQALTNKTLTSPTITNPSTTGTDSGAETLQNKTISGSANTLSNIAEAALTLSDNTTGNVSTSAHGFVPKGTNTGTKYLRDDGTWGTPPAAAFAVGVMLGLTTYDVSTASGTQNIAHGLGTTPKFAKLTITGPTGAAFNAPVVVGAYNGTTFVSIYSDGNGHIATNGIRYGDTTNWVTASLTFDGTNLKIAWTKTNSPTGVINIMWEAWA
jgi:hypothetical protein